MIPRWQNLSDPIFHHAALRPDAPAIVDGSTVLNYGEWASLVGKASVYLASLGIGPGDRIGVRLDNRIDHLVLMFAVLRVGAHLTELPSLTSADRDAIDRLGICRIFAEPAEPGAAPISLPVVTIDAHWRSSLQRFDGDHRHDAAGDAIATVTLSSGSTGKPKGIAITHQQFFARYHVAAEIFAATGAHAYEKAPPFLLASSLAYYGFFRNFISQVSAGGATVLLPLYQEPAAFTTAVQRHGEVVLVATANMCRALVTCAPPDGLTLPRLTALISLGQPLYAEEKRAIVARVTPNFYDNYGAAGIGGITCLMPHDVAAHAASVGRTVPGIAVEIVDQNGSPLPAGAIGRLRCRSETAANGFVAAEGSRDEGFVDGWYYPGEMASLDADGYLTIAGRSAEIIRRNGVEFFPPAIEAAIATHPAVREVAVVGRKGPDGSDEVYAFIVAQGALTWDDIKRHCTGRLPRQQWPTHFTLLPALPKLASGKTDRARLRYGAMRQVPPRQGFSNSNKPTP